MAAVFFSVVISAYNAEQFILSALKSIRAQFEKDYEVLVVDNGSLDKTGEVIQQFIQENSMMDMKQITFRENQGISGGRNAGIAQASGRYICFLDADDYWYPDKLAVMKKAIQEHKGYHVFWHWEDHIGAGYKKQARYREVNNKNAYMDLLFHNNCLSTSAVAVQAGLIKKEGGFRTNLCSGEEDYDCWLRMARGGAKFFLVKKTLGVFRISGNSVSSKYIRHYKGIINMLRGHFAYLAQASGQPGRIWRIWRKKKAQYLCSLGRQLSLTGDRAGAFRMYRRAMRSDMAYMKTYAGIALAILNR